MSQLKDSRWGESKFCLTQFFVLFGPSVDWVGHRQWGGQCPQTTIQIFISSRNTFTDASRMMFNQNVWTPSVPGKSTYENNPHTPSTQCRLTE